MKKCKSCQKEIDTKANKCPYCQSDQRNWFAKHKIITSILGVIILFSIMGAAGGSKSGNNTSSPASNNTTAESKNDNTQQDSKPKEWVTVIEISGNSAKRTDIFQLKGGKSKLTYTFDGGDSIVGAVYVMKEGTSLQKQGGFPEVIVSTPGTDSTFLAKDAGSYYLDISSANTNWTVKIEEER